MNRDRDMEDDQPVRPNPLHTDANVGDEGIGTDTGRSEGSSSGDHVNEADEEVAKSENRGAGLPTRSKRDEERAESE